MTRLKNSQFCGVCFGRVTANPKANLTNRRECCGIVGCKALAAAGYAAKRVSGGADGGRGNSTRKKRSAAKKEADGAAAAHAEEGPEPTEDAAADSTAGASRVSVDEEVSVPSVETEGNFLWDGDDGHPLVEGSTAGT